MHHAGAHYAGANYSARTHHHAACHHPDAAYHHPRATKPSYYHDSDYNDATYYHFPTTHDYDPAASHHDGLRRAGARPCPAHAGWQVPQGVPGREGWRLLPLTYSPEFC